MRRTNLCLQINLQLQIFFLQLLTCLVCSKCGLRTTTMRMIPIRPEEHVCACEQTQLPREQQPANSFHLNKFCCLICQLKLCETMVSDFVWGAVWISFRLFVVAAFQECSSAFNSNLSRLVQLFGRCIKLRSSTTTTNQIFRPPRCASQWAGVLQRLWHLPFSSLLQLVQRCGLA